MAPLLAAGLALLGIVAAGILAFGVDSVARFDTRVANSFWMLQRGGLIASEKALTNTVDPVLFSVLAVLVLGAAASRRQPSLVAAVAVILVGSNLCTEALKAIMPHHHIVLLGSPSVVAGAFPSGHATACMSLVLSAVIVTPPWLRPPVSVAGAVYALGVAVALLVLGVHYPSDVIGGCLMAGAWALLVLAGLRAVEAPREGRSGVGFPTRGWSVTTCLSWVLAGGIVAMAVAIKFAPPEIVAGGLASTWAVIAVIITGMVALVARLAPRG